MYKRKARVLFVSGDPIGAPVAQAWACLRGADWVEARAACLDPRPPDALAVSVMREAGVELSFAPPVPLTPALLAWPDLVVTLCRDSETQVQALPAGVQKKYWPARPPGTRAESGSTDALRLLRDDLRERVDGLVGGMRMLAKMDADERERDD